MLNLAVTQRAQYLDPNGVPYSGARLSFLDVNTGFLKSIYADPDSVTELTNPIILDIGGYVPESGIFYGEGNYSIKLEKLDNPGEPIPTYSQVWHMPNVPGTPISATGVGLSYIYLESVEDIQNLPLGTYDYVYAFNYYSNNNDKGGGWFRWEPASTATTNLGTIFALSASPSIGRFIRKYEGNITTAMFGCCPNRSVNMGSRLLQATTWAKANSETLEFENGTIEIDGDVNIVSCNVQVNAGFKFKRLTPLVESVLTFTDCNIEVMQKSEEIAENSDATHYVKFMSGSQFNIYPEWFGAVGNGVADCYQAFNVMQFSEGLRTLEGQYQIIATGAPITAPIDMGNTYFGEYAWINNQLTSVISFDEVTSHFDAQHCVRTPSSDFFTYAFNAKMEGQVLFPLTITVSMYSTLADVMSVGYIEFKGKRKNYTYIGGGDITAPIDIYIEAGITLNITGANADIGNVVSGPWRVFDATMAYYPKNTQLIYPQWWGAGRTATTSVNELSIRNAIYTASNLIGGGEINGNNEPLVIGSDLVLTSTGIAKATNLVISGANLNFSSGGMTARNCKLSGYYAEGTSKMNLTNCELIGSVGSALKSRGTITKFSNCLIANFTDMEFGSQTLASSVVRIFGGSFVGCDGGIINTKSGLTINGVVFESMSIPDETGSPFDKSVFLVKGFSNSSIVNNTIYFTDSSTDVASYRWAFFRFEGTGESVISSVLANNTFDITVTQSGGSANIWYAWRADGFADYGHRVKIGNNSSSEDCRIYQNSASANVVSNGIDDSIIQFFLIFPYASTPTYRNWRAPVLYAPIDTIVANDGEATATYTLETAPLDALFLLTIDHSHPQYFISLA